MTQKIVDSKAVKKVELAIEAFKTGHVTFRDAAAKAELDYWDFQFELEKRGIPIMRDVSLAEKRINFVLKRR